jgi:nucleolar protein 56
MRDRKQPRRDHTKNPDKKPRDEGRSYDERFDKRARFMKRAKQTVMEALRSRDMLVASVTKSIEDLDKTINLLGERFEDWYGIYFPELKTEEKLQYCNAALVIDRENMDEKELAATLGQKRSSELAAAAKTSLGVKLSPKDHSQCLSLARLIISMEKLRKEYEEYQKELAMELCPNLSEVGGPDIAAKLVSHVGSLSRLAMLPASAVQVLGAEKALFKHLKNRRIPPPKHGIIFQHVRISSSPKAVRGRIARVLANQLSLAAKADAFSKRDISSMLKKKFDERFAQIMKEYEAEKTKAPASSSASGQV